VTRNDTLDSFGGYISRNLVVHLHEDEPAISSVLGVLLQDGVRGGSSARERVEHQASRWSAVGDHALHQRQRLRKREYAFVKNLVELSRSRLRLELRPKAGCRHSFLRFGQKALLARPAGCRVGWPPDAVLGQEPLVASTVGDPALCRVWLPDIGCTRLLHVVVMEIGAFGRGRFSLEGIGDIGSPRIVIWILEV
jgi:hypothetical protein